MTEVDKHGGVGGGEGSESVFVSSIFVKLENKQKGRGAFLDRGGHNIRILYLCHFPRNMVPHIDSCYN